MSLWTGIKNFFENLGPTKSSDHDHETHIDGASKRRSPLGLSFPRLVNISHKRHSGENKTDTRRSKDPTLKASATNEPGRIDSQVFQKPTDSVTGHSGLSPSNQRPRAPSTISSTTHESIQTANHDQAKQSGVSSSASTSATSTSASTTPPPSDSESSDLESDRYASEASYESLDEYEERMAKHRALFDRPDPATRDQRRKALHDLPNEYFWRAARWLHAHPEDIWATAEEQEANFSRMRADARVKKAEWQDKHGLDVLREDRPKEYKMLRKRAKVVGWYSALQETVFREEWLAEGGMFGQKGSGGPPPEEVGPMGETL